MTETTPGEMLRIGDLVEVPDIKTVIQLQDLEDPDLRNMILESFVLTDEVLNNLRAILTAMCGGKGRGVFLKGHFGSGKSHFLSMLSMLLRFPQSWETIIEQTPSLLQFKEKLAPLHFLVVDISLVRHRSSEFLEDIFLKALFHAIHEQTGKEAKGAESRQNTFSEIRSILDGKGFSGIVFLVDELSEFLKSKPDARVYNEDVRFLQYLGEEAWAFPFWIVASLQEWIEETGEIHQDTFNKIKDRYRIRLNLGRAHIEELISERLIRHRQGAEAGIEAVFHELKSYFPSFPVPEERFLRLYPVHPATSVLLDRLKPLFSEHRGVVDFIHFRLKGDPERNIPSILNEPAHCLLTPEKIFDHFLERILERSETQVYVEKVYRFYEAAVPDLFPDPDQQRVALVLVKLLILFAISPVHYKYRSRHLAEMVLFEVTPLDTSINYQFVHDILDRLEKEGSYIRAEKSKDVLDNHYVIDLKADISGFMRQRIRHMASEIFPDDTRLFTKLGALVESPYLPLAGWLEHGQEQVSTTWQHTTRTGIIYLKALDTVSVEEIEDAAKQWCFSEDDFFVFVGTTQNREAQLNHIKTHLLPVIRDKYPGVFLFWVPSDMGEDLDRLREIMAALLLQERMFREPSPRAKEENAFVQSFLDRSRPSLVEQFVRCYYDGDLLWDENHVDLSRFGKLTQEKFLAEFSRPMLERRFPRHNRIRPFMDAFVPNMLKEMLLDFLASGILIVDDKSKFGLRNILEGLLKPMGLVRKQGNRYELQLNPLQNELAREFFAHMGERQTVPLEDMYWHFRKGDYGLLMPQFELLVLALLFSGHLVAYVTTNRRSPEELRRKGIKGITALGKGEILRESVRQVLQAHPMVPKKFRKQPLTLASQEELWAEMRKRKPEALEELKGFRSRVSWASSLQAFKNFPWEKLTHDIDLLISQWEELKVSLPSKDGLERFLQAGRDEPELPGSLDRIEDAKGFLQNAERALFVYQYLTDSKLLIPDSPDYQALKEARSFILTFFQETPATVSGDLLDTVFKHFQKFQELYIRSYVDAHHGARGGPHFDSYEKLKDSAGFKLLRRLDRLEMISVEHDFRTVDQEITSVLVQRCRLSPQDQLQLQPVCKCGYRLGEKYSFKKTLRELQEEIDLGIQETFEAIKSPAIQERIIPYLESLDSVGKEDEANAIRRFLDISPGQPDFLDLAEQMLTSRIIQDINQAFRGKVVVVKRDLDSLYRDLVHRKYTIFRTRKIISQWLEAEELPEDTFVHFLGASRVESGDRAEDLFREFIESSPDFAVSLYRELGHREMSSAIIASLWSGQYSVPLAGLTEIFPFLKRGGERNELIEALANLCALLRSKNPALFDSLVSQFEADPAIIQTLWSLIPSASPEEIFHKETVLPGILKRAFERMLGAEQKNEALQVPPEPGSANTMATSAFQEQRALMLEALAACSELQDKAESLKGMASTNRWDFQRWEALYLDKIAPLPFLVSSLHNSLEKLSVTIPLFLRKQEMEIKEKARNISDSFRRFYQEQRKNWENSDGTGPLMIEEVPFLLRKRRGVPDYNKLHFVLMDGMRWDLWQTIRKGFFGKMEQHFRVVKEGALWAHLPTDTPTQLTHFEEALSTFDPRYGPEDILLKVTGIDERIHTEKGPLTHLFANIVRFLEIDLAFRLKEMPSGTLLVLFSDHGFVENPHFNPADKYASPRYVHGGDSPFEVIVPWAWVMRI